MSHPDPGYKLRLEHPRLGILDWGIGGLSYLGYLKEKHPGIRATYFSDSGQVPYGRLSKEELLKRLHTICSFLHDLGVDHLVVACNAMSTVLNESVRSIHGIQTSGIIGPTVEKLKKSEFNTIGIIGGRRTIMSRVYSIPLKTAGKSVKQRIAQPLSALIEKGDTGSPFLIKTLNNILQPIRNVDVLVLGCTHYVAVLPVIRKLMKGTRIFDPSKLAVSWTDKRDFSSFCCGTNIFLTTGDVSSMRRAAFNAFKINIDHAYRVTL